MNSISSNLTFLPSFCYFETDAIPLDVALKIFSFSPSDVKSATLVCKNWSLILKSNSEFFRESKFYEFLKRPPVKIAWPPVTINESNYEKYISSHGLKHSQVIINDNQEMILFPNTESWLVEFCVLEKEGKFHFEENFLKELLIFSRIQKSGHLLAEVKYFNEDHVSMHQLRLYDLKTKQQIQEFTIHQKHEPHCHAFVVSKESDHLTAIAQNQDGVIHILKENKLLYDIPHDPAEKSLTCKALALNSQYLFAVYHKKNAEFSVAVFDLNEKKVINRFLIDDFLNISHTSKGFFLATFNKTIKLHSLAPLTCETKVIGEILTSSFTEFEYEEGRFITVTNEKIFIFELTNKRLREIVLEKPGFPKVKIHENLMIMIPFISHQEETNNKNFHVEIWNLTSLTKIQNVKTATMPLGIEFGLTEGKMFLVINCMNQLEAYLVKKKPDDIV